MRGRAFTVQIGSGLKQETPCRPRLIASETLFSEKEYSLLQNSIRLVTKPSAICMSMLPKDI